MWKKISVLFLSLLATFSVINVINQSLLANSTVPANFKIGGITWRVLYEDEKSYLVSTKSVVSEFCPTLSTANIYVLTQDSKQCFSELKTKYLNNLLNDATSDEFGKRVINNPNNKDSIKNISEMGLERYNLLTSNGTDVSLMKSISTDFWVVADTLGTSSYYDDRILGLSTPEVTFMHVCSQVYPILQVQLHDDLNSLEFTNVYQAGASASNIYEYKANVKAGMKVGSVTTKDGASPIQYTLKDDPAHVGDASKFVVSGSDILVGSQDLDAGDYNFIIQAQDKYGKPTTPLEVSVNLKVQKALPTISIKDMSKSDISIGSASLSGIIETSNTDTIGTSDVTYTLSGGVVGVLNVKTNESNPLKYDLSVVDTHSGSGLPATFKLNATIGETKNYKSATTTNGKEIYVYRALSALTWTPSKNSFQTSEVNTIGTVVGNLAAVDGVGPYVYELVKKDDSKYDSNKGADNDSFSISNVESTNKADVKTNSVLTEKTYKIQFKVTDAKGASTYTSGTIQVNAKSQTAIDFVDKAGGSIITGTGQRVKFNDTSAQLIAEGGSTSKDVVYDYAPSSMQPSGVDPTAYATINSSNGLVSSKRTGTIKVQALKPGDEIYGDVVVYMDLIIDAAEQVIAFNNKESVVNIEIGKELLLDAKGLIKATNETGIGSITYKSSDETIATVDKSTGKVTGIKAGTAIITATLNDSNESAYNSNYDTVSATKSVKIYKGMSVNFTAVSPNKKANNVIGDKVGTLNVSDHASDPGFDISTGSTTENADASFFQVIDNGTSADLQLSKVVTPTDWVNHGGSFKVQVKVSDTNGSQLVDIVVAIDEADNTVSFTEGGKNITSLTKKFGENGNSFNLNSISSNGGSATYSVIPNPNSVLGVSGAGVVSVKTSGKATVQVLISSGNGYAQKTVTMPVTIDLGDQAIAFKDSDTVNQQFVLNETFSDPAELKETSLNTVSTRTITYTSNDMSVCTIDAAGTITMLQKGTCDITASNSDPNWTAVSVNKKISLYDGMGVSFIPSANLQAEMVSTTAGSKAGSLTVNGGIGNKTYAVSTVSNPKNRDKDLFLINSTGVVSFKKAILANDLKGKYNATKKVYELYVQFETTDSGNTKVTTDAIVEVKGAPLKAEFDTNGTGKITEEFGSGKTFALSLSSNKGNGVPTYQLKNDDAMPSDVLSSVDASGLVTIQHANDPTFIGNPLMVEAVIPANDGYDEETIEVEVEITKAPQPDFAFKTPNIKLGHGASITPMFTGNLSTGTITMTSGNNALATISGNDIKAKTTDGSVVVTAIDSGDRDYKDATATANVTISSAPAYNFVINVPAATYGDTGLKAAILINGATGANKVQTWSSSDPSIADVDADKNITIKKAGTVTISCTQTSTGEPSVTATAVMVIDPKPITVTINNASKYVGEAVPTFSAVIPTDDLVGSDTLGQPTFSCKDGTALVKPDTKAGTYDINGTYPTGQNPNYAITVQKGILTIKQDTSLTDWFHLEGVTSKTTLDNTKWVNEDVNVVLDEAIESAGTYDEISLDKTLWGTTQIIDKEGITTSDVHFRINASIIIATPQTTTVKIDKTKPVVKSITGTPAQRNALSELLNTLTFGKYFKPKYEVSILAEDVLPKDVKENSKLKAIQYNVYQLKDDATLGEAIASGEMQSGDTLKLVDEGKYMVCATALDNAGNQSAELCSGIRIKSMGESSDGKELPDINIDTDGDGIADINITRPGEKKPYLNIDTNGDGIPDINISKEGEEVIPGTTKPFLNIISPEVKWSPTKEIDFDKDGIPDFRIDDTLEPILSIDSNDDKIPDLNIDLDGDYIPEINIDASGDKIPETNIDSDGDGVADINIDKTGTGIPQERICTTVVWNPTTMVKKDGVVIYGTTADLKPDSKDSLTDNGIIIKPSKPGSIFLPNYALKVEDVTKNIESSTKNQIIEVTGPNSEVKQVFDVSLSDGDKVIQPDGSILVRIPVDTSIKNPRVLLRNKAGVFEEVEVSLEDGYYVFETDYLGTVSIVGDKDEVVTPNDPKDPAPTPTPNPTSPSTTKPNTSVKGTYTSGTGGALTGDSHQPMLLISLCSGSALLLSFIIANGRKRNS